MPDQRTDDAPTSSDAEWRAWVERRFKAGDEKMGQLASGLGTVSRDLKANTQITQEIRDIFAAVRSGFKVLGWLGTAAHWIGKIALAVGAIAGAWWAIFHGGRPPSSP